MGTELYPSELCVNGIKPPKTVAQVFLLQNYEGHSLLPLDVRISKVPLSWLWTTECDNWWSGNHLQTTHGSSHKSIHNRLGFHKFHARCFSEEPKTSTSSIVWKFPASFQSVLRVVKCHCLGRNTYLPLGCGDETPDYGMEASAVAGERNFQMQRPGGEWRFIFFGGGGITRDNTGTLPRECHKSKLFWCTVWQAVVIISQRTAVTAVEM